MNPQQIKNYAIAAGAVVVAYALYQAVAGVRSFFAGPEPYKGPKVQLGKRMSQLDATELLLLQGKITMAEAERRKYPERFKNAPKVSLTPVPTPVNTDRYGVVKPPCLFCI